jgi:GTPase SAR1 family protein
MNILDTAGMEDYRALSDNWIDGKDAIILVCSVEIKTSLEHLRSEYDNIKARFYDNPS